MTFCNPRDRRRPIGSALRIFVAMAAAAPLASNTAWAQGPTQSLWSGSGGDLRSEGFATSLTLRIPLGQEKARAKEPSVSLGFGPTWRRELSSPEDRRGWTVPTIEAGIRFDGTTFIRAGSFDLHSVREWNLNLDATTPPADDTWIWWTVGGLALAGLVAIAASNYEDEWTSSSCPQNTATTIYTCYYVPA